MKKNTKINVHSHIVKAFTIIDEYLPYRYVDKVKEIHNAPEGSIRNVRNSRSGNVKIVNALLKVALNEKKSLEEMEMNH